MADNNQVYLDLITSEYAEKPKFNAYVLAFLEEVSPSVECLEQFSELFNLQNAVGDQLDKCGELVALTRELPISDPDIPSVLPDDIFRIVIQARILANFWDGTIQGWEKLISVIFPDASYNIVDNQDMTVNVVMIDPSSTATLTALLLNGYLIPKPSGVLVNWTIQENALFGWDTDNAFLTGWDAGIWSST